jgi:hypothetical protein
MAKSENPEVYPQVVKINTNQYGQLNQGRAKRTDSFVFRFRFLILRILFIRGETS